MEELAEVGWNIYSLKEKNMKMELHFDFLKTCREENIVPNGLKVNKLSAVGQEDETFKNKWNGILRECSLKLMECLVEHYEKQLAHNVGKIAESYESLEKSEHWTGSDEAHLEEEIQSILKAKKKQLKEEKQSKLEAARRKKTDQQTLHLAGLEKYLNSTLPVGQVTLNFCLSGALTRLPKFSDSLICLLYTSPSPRDA